MMGTCQRLLSVHRVLQMTDAVYVKSQHCYAGRPKTTGNTPTVCITPQNGSLNIAVQGCSSQWGICYNLECMPWTTPWTSDVTHAQVPNVADAQP